MEIPRDVLLAGIRAALAQRYPRGSFRADIDHDKRLDQMTAERLDHGMGDSISVAIAAAIEAWETRPHPWGELPATGTDDSDPPAPDIDAERERFAAFAEEWIRDGSSVATIIRHYYGRGEDMPDSDATGIDPGSGVPLWALEAEYNSREE